MIYRVRSFLSGKPACSCRFTATALNSHIQDHVFVKTVELCEFCEQTLASNYLPIQNKYDGKVISSASFTANYVLDPIGYIKHKKDNQ